MAEGFEEATGSDLRLESATLTTLGTRDKQGTGKSPCGVQVGDGGRGLGWQQQEEGGGRVRDVEGGRPVDRWPWFGSLVSFIQLEGEGGERPAFLLALHSSTHPRRLCWGL